MKQPVICIPRISKYISVYDIKTVFDSYKFGTVENINIVPGIETNKVFVKYNRWNNRHQTNIFRRELLEENNIKLFYDFPNYWKCYKSFKEIG